MEKQIFKYIGKSMNMYFVTYKWQKYSIKVQWQDLIVEKVTLDCFKFK